MTKLLRYLSYLALALIVLGIALALFSQTSIFKNWLKDKIVSIVNESLEASLRVESLRGNLVDYVELVGVSLDLDGVEIARIERAAVQLEPFALFSMTLALPQIVLESPRLKIKQIDSVNWSYNRVLKQKAALNHESTGEAAVLTWRLMAPDIRVMSGSLEISRLARGGDRNETRIDDLNLEAGLQIAGDVIQATLANLQFRSRNPDLLVRSLKTQLSYNAHKLTATDTRLETERSVLRSELEWTDLPNQQINLMLKGKPLSLPEFRTAIPELPDLGNLDLEIRAKGNLSELEISSIVNIANSRLSATALLQLADEPYQYQMKGTARQFDLALFTSKQELTSDLNFAFDVAGKGLTWGQLNSRFKIDFESSSAMGRRFSPTGFRGNVSGDSLTFELNSTVHEAQLSTRGMLIANSNQTSYNLDGEIVDLDLSNFFSDSLFQSDLDLQVQLQGSGIELEKLAARLAVRALPSHFNEFAIDSASVIVTTENQLAELDELSLTSPMGRLRASGLLAWNGESLVDFEAQLADFAAISALVGRDSLAGSGHFAGHLKGSLDSLEVNAEGGISKLSADNFDVEQMTFEGSGTYSDGKYGFHLEGEMADARISEVDSLQASFRLTNRDSVADFWVRTTRPPDLTAEFQGQFLQGKEHYWVLLQDLQLTVKDQKWRKFGGETEIGLKDSQVSLTELSLNSRDETVTLAGYFDPEGDSDLRLELANLRISSYDSVFGFGTGLDGIATVAVSYAGRLENPNLDGSVELREGRLLDVPFDAFSGAFQANANLARWTFVLSKTAEDSLLESSGFVPLKMTAETNGYQINDAEALECKFNARGFDLSLVQPFISGVHGIKGNLIADIVLTNTLQDLRGVGPIRVVGGEFNVPELGTRYRNISAAMLLKDKDLILRDFRLRSDGGRLELIEGGLSLSERSLKDFSTRFKVVDFPLINNKKMIAKVRGELELKGSVQSPYFSGDLAVTESRTFYPAWFADEAVVELSSQPFFVIGVDSVQRDTTGAIRFQKAKRRKQEAFSESDFYKNLQGELALKFPRNSWIRSGDTNIEISGDLVAVKERGAEMSLFGSLSTLRGHYELLGNRFQIVRGNLVFYGQADPDPGVDIEAEYEFRDQSAQDAQKHVFNVLISGSLSTPEFRFQLDGRPAEQTDIVSILLFGQSYDDLAISQRSSVSDNSGLGDRATGLITGQLLRRLSGELGEELSLDVIQIESGKDFEDARLRIGKYVTPDVFVSISQDFGAEGNRKVELEYEIPLQLKFFNLLLQASRERRGATGVDVIWKIEW